MFMRSPGLFLECSLFQKCELVPLSDVPLIRVVI